MTRPQEFEQQQTIRHETPYRVDEHFAKGPMAGVGVLTTGRVVWTKQASETPAAETKVTVFADGIGVVAVEAHSLQS